MQNIILIILTSAILYCIYKQNQTQPDIPLYLGIFAENNELTRTKITNFATNTLMEYYKHHQEEDDLVMQQMYTDLANGLNYRFATNFHITALFIGNNMSKLETDYFKDFQQGLKLEIYSATIVFVPNKLIAGLVFPDQSQVKIENKFPHTTLYLQDWNAVDSNDVWQALCDENGPLHQQYIDGLLKPDSPYQLQQKYSNMTIKGENVDVYVVKTNQKFEKLQLDAETKYGYK